MKMNLIYDALVKYIVNNPEELNTCNLDRIFVFALSRISLMEFIEIAKQMSNNAVNVPDKACDEYVKLRIESAVNSANKIFEYNSSVMSNPELVAKVIGHILQHL